ncbi:hypothetical protein [Sulfurisphaera ohwakuensis]|uniref:Uncharacterized protein n=1 Tax=Sulfurisphaera ohwakuensis TaxID=69656 RepID=A0A650CFH8_SULOH|nr:hypothetical protein [Sulfurisphaera ohwakuensis]MBB5255282.1 hypothetical protein [Sulfurisphaera ohwakuensis]QGR16496.1 hypothetical protein D1869_04235 [Sulfurisphaera ohwakuensis]
MNNIVRKYLIISCIAFLLSIPPSFLSPLKLKVRFLGYVDIIVIFALNSIVYLLIYILVEHIKVESVALLVSFVALFSEFYIAWSAIFDNLMMGYFTIFLAFMEFYIMFRFSKELIKGFIALFILAIIEVIVYDIFYILI